MTSHILLSRRRLICQRGHVIIDISRHNSNYVPEMLSLTLPYKNHISASVKFEI